ncbi:MAG: phage antirepressor [Firmicutes bacterium]|jgi:anti-repressor protein|nr:phage antirepressor [Bacillota bacterium]
MNNLQIFRNEQFGEVRAIEINGEPWLVGKDVATILGYSKPLNALATHVDEDDSLKQGLIDSLGRKQDTIVINESGLYSLILGSKLPQAKQFKKWVTAEVLPSIRKHGGYIKDQEKLSDDELLSKALLVAQSKIKERDKEIERMKPKEIFADAVATSKASILIGELAKMLRQNGVEIGQNRLFTWLRDNGYLIKRNGTDYNMPTQSAMEKGLFEIKETVISHSDGHSTVNKTPKVTGKGQQYFINKFLV